MKKLNRFALTAIMSLFALSAFAQTDWDFEWEQYHIVFTLAEDFKVTTNTAEEFTAQGDGMQFGIFPFSDESVDHSNIADYTVEIAKSIELEEVDDADVVELNGLQGAYVEGYKDGARVVLLGFLDPNSDTNFFSVITFADDDKTAEEEAVRIIKSFRKKK